MKPDSLTAAIAANARWAGSRIVSLLIASVVAGIASLAANPGPKIHFDQPIFDFGKVDSGELIKHEFIFTNMGNQLLEVREVRPSCGCTTAGMWDKHVEPGKSGKIPVQFNSAGYVGTGSKNVFVVSNDPAQTNLALQIKGTIWRP